MLMYYLNNNNEYSVRVNFNDVYISGNTFLQIENMTDFKLTDIPLIDELYVDYEQILKFELTLEDVKEGDQFRCVLFYNNKTIWKGSISVEDVKFNDKKVYETKLNNITYNDNNDYIILEN